MKTSEASTKARCAFPLDATIAEVGAHDAMLLSTRSALRPLHLALRDQIATAIQHLISQQSLTRKVGRVEKFIVVQPSP